MNNETIIKFLEKYWIATIVGIALAIFVLIPFLKSFDISGDYQTLESYDLNTLKIGSRVLFQDKIYTVDDLNVYDYIGKVSLELREEK